MQKINDACINTGKFAHLCSTNKRTLFYYDEIGLFSPIYTDEKGYRYYSESQCDVFFTITCLKEIGMPLGEIKQYIQNRNPEDLKKLLWEQQEKVRMELVHLKRMEQVIQTKISLVDAGNQLNATVFQRPILFSEVLVEELEEELFVLSAPLFTEEHDRIIEVLYAHIGYCNKQKLNTGHPYGAMMSTKDMLTHNWDMYAYFCTKIQSNLIAETYCGDLISGSLISTEDTQTRLHIKPSGNYAVIYLKGSYYNAQESYEKLLEYINIKRHAPGAFFYKEAVLDEISVSTEEEYITKISVQII